MKISIRFFNDREVRAAWNEENSKWYFSVLDVIGAIRNESSYEKCRNYWKYLKAKLKKKIKMSNAWFRHVIILPTGCILKH